jgi:hypothetical protein
VVSKVTLVYFEGLSRLHHPVRLHLSSLAAYCHKGGTVMRAIWMRFLLPVIVGMSAALTASMILHPEQISRRSAVHFFQDYYKLALKESGRDRTWEMLSPDFQKEAVKGGRRAYNGFFSGMKEVSL